MTLRPALVLVRPERESSEVRDLVAKAHETAERVDIPPIKTFRARRGSVVGEHWQRPVQFLEPTDAREIYRLVHRWRTLVLSFTRVYVRRNPSRQPAERRAALELATYVEHKAGFELIRSQATLQAAIRDFKDSAGGVSCAGENDPRCLPLHVFSVDRDWSVLSEQHGRNAFEELHGPARSRVDSDSKRWARADRGAYHGRDKLTVAGFELPAGMHWDVTSERGRTQITTANEIWTLPRGARGYVNVYPDAYVRPGTRSAARRTWPANRRRM